MMMEEMGLIPLESNLHKIDPVVISQIIQMIEMGNFWHLKTFEVVLTKLWRRWDNRKMCPCTGQKIAKSTMKWMEKKLLTCVAKSDHNQ